MAIQRTIKSRPAGSGAKNMLTALRLALNTMPLIVNNRTLSFISG